MLTRLPVLPCQRSSAVVPLPLPLQRTVLYQVAAFRGDRGQVEVRVSVLVIQIRGPNKKQLGQQTDRTLEGESADVTLDGNAQSESDIFSFS